MKIGLNHYLDLGIITHHLYQNNLALTSVSFLCLTELSAALHTCQGLYENNIALILDLLCMLALYCKRAAADYVEDNYILKYK